MKRFYIDFDVKNVPVDLRDECYHVLKSDLHDCDGPKYYDTRRDADIDLCEWINTDATGWWLKMHKQGLEAVINEINIED